MNDISNSSKQEKKQIQRKPVQRIRLESSATDKISDAVMNTMRNIGLLLAKLFDKIFGTSISKNPVLNKKIITGKRVKQEQGNNYAQSKQAGKRHGQVKISKSEPVEDREKAPSLIQIKDVLNGRASDGALRKQQERQAEAGHRFFSHALKTEQNSAMSRNH